jgi:DNA-binding PadR family transcriptional regulator
MGQTRAESSQLASKEVVLGLLIRQPDNPYQLDQRMDKLLGSARYGRGTAEHALEVLLREGCVCAVGGDTAVPPTPRRMKRKTTYAATPVGVERFRRWLAASTSMPPVREELHAKMALCKPADLPLLVSAVMDAELACMAKLQEANRRVQSERQVVDEQAWRRRMAIVVSSSEMAWWDSRIKWLLEVRVFLQKEWESFRQVEQRVRPG